MPPAQVKALISDYTIAILTPVFTTALIVGGIVVALAIALRKTSSSDRADVIRAVAEVFRWFRKGGPPGAA